MEHLDKRYVDIFNPNPPILRRKRDNPNESHS
jgi:hypothetical protein